jgi:transcriptional regulator with XRE-family HTH domain
MNKNSSRRIGLKNIQKIIEASKFKQADLARIMKTDKVTMNRWVRDIREINLDTMDRFIEVFHILDKGLKKIKTKDLIDPNFKFQIRTIRKIVIK